MDFQIKRIRDILKKNNVLNNTLIWFTSDNGPEGNHAGPWGNNQWPGRTNGLRGRKRDVYEGGIREPTIIEFNGLIRNKNGFNSTFPIVTYDFLPTIMDLLSIKYPISPSWELDGISLVDLFKDPVNVNIRKKPIGWKQGRASAWMDNRWKLVTNSKNCRHMGRGACNPALFEIETIDVKQQHQTFLIE